MHSTSSEKFNWLVRSAIAAAAAVVLIVATVNIYRLSTVATDENLFRTSPSRLYVRADLIARKAASDSSEAGSRLIMSGTDTIPAGAFLLEVDRERVSDAGDLKRVLSRFADEDWVKTKYLPAEESRSYHTLSQKQSLISDSVSEIPPSVYIIDVKPHGASDRAGLRKGDIITAINGLGFSNAHEADQILRRSEQGSTLDYVVIRDGETNDLHVTLAKYGIPTASIFVFLTGLMFWVTGLFIALKRPQIKAARLLGLSMILLSFPFFAFYQRLPFGDPLSELLLIVNMTCLMFSMTLWYHTSLYFPKEQPQLLQKRWITIVPYSITIVSWVIVVLSILQGNFLGIMCGISIAAVVLFGLVVAIVYRKKKASSYKKLNRPLRWVWALAFLLSVVVAFLVRHFGSHEQTGFTALPWLFVPIAYLYVIGRNDLLDLRIKVRRSVVYAAVSALWIVALLSVAVAAFVWLANSDLHLPYLRFSSTYVEIVNKPPPPEVKFVQEKIILMLAAVLLAAVSWYIRRKGQRLIDRLFYQTPQYDYRRAIREFSDVMATKLSMDDLARGIVQKLAEQMQLKSAGVLFFRNEKQCCCREGFGFDGQDWHSICMAIDDGFAESIKSFHSGFQIDYLADAHKDIFRQHGIQYIIPVRSKEKLAGALLIGEKRSEATFKHEDLAFLSAASSHASVAIENAFLYEELAEQERLKHELTIARRIQMASLPQRTPKIDGLEISGVSIPATEVGGDYLDYLNGTSTDLTILVGDVSGKGTSAALYMSKMQGIFRSLHAFGLGPRELFIRANQLLMRDMERSSFITSVSAAFDTKSRTLVLARAGHLPLLYYHAATGQVESIAPKGIGLGLEPGEAFAANLEERAITYQPGDVFVFVTDGITEARTTNGDEFGEEQLSQLVGDVAGYCAEEIRETILRHIKNFSNGVPQNDDQTIVVVKVT